MNFLVLSKVKDKRKKMFLPIVVTMYIKLLVINLKKNVSRRIVTVEEVYDFKTVKYVFISIL